MNTRTIVALVAVGAVLLVVLSSFGFRAAEQQPQAESVKPTPPAKTEQATPSTPEIITLSGTYVCLPFLPDVAKTADCAFGIRADDGTYYAVNFGASAGSMADFRNGARITAKGTLILRENLRPNSWTKFDMKGLFTVLEKQ